MRSGWLLMAGVLSTLQPAVGVAPWTGGRWVVDPRRQRPTVVRRQSPWPAASRPRSTSRWPTRCRCPGAGCSRPPEPSLRRVRLRDNPAIIPREGTTLCVYAPASGLLSRPARTVFDPARAELRRAAAEPEDVPNSWAVIERGMLMHGEYMRPSTTPGPSSTGSTTRRTSCTIDPVTLLDTHPEAAFSAEPRNVGLTACLVAPASDPGPQSRSGDWPPDRRSRP